MRLYYGVDVGTHTVKGVVMALRRRTWSLVRAEEIPWSVLEEEGMGPLLDRLDVPAGSSVHVGISGRVFTRTLSLPIRERRKIEGLLPFEMGDDLPMEPDELVFSFLHSVEGRESHVLAAAVPKEVLDRIITAVERSGRTAERILLRPAHFRSLVPRNGIWVVAELGHRYVSLTAIRDGRERAIQILSHGMERLVRDLAKYSGQPEASIQAWLQQGGFVSEEHEGEEGYEGIIRNHFDSLIARMKPFLADVVEREGGQAEGMLLVGGPARLRGLPEYLGSRLGLSCAPLEYQGIDPLYLPAVAVAMAGSLPHRETLDFRVGPYALHAGRSVVKEKLLTITMALAVTFSSMVAAGKAKHSRLVRTEEALLEYVGELSQEVLGKRMYSYYSIKKKIRKKFGAKGGGGEMPIPKISAYALLTEMVKNMPPRKEGSDSGEEKPVAGEKTAAKEAERSKDATSKGEGREAKKESLAPVTLDIRKLSIRAQKIVIEGLVDTASEVDELIKGLKRIECFKSFETGNITPVRDRDKQRRKFTITIKTECM